MGSLKSTRRAGRLTPAASVLVQHSTFTCNTIQQGFSWVSIGSSKFQQGSNGLLTPPSRYARSTSSFSSRVSPAWCQASPAHTAPSPIGVMQNAFAIPREYPFKGESSNPSYIPPSKLYPSLYGVNPQYGVYNAQPALARVTRVRPSLSCYTKIWVSHRTCST
jgi:hypothetical protein